MLEGMGAEAIVADMANYHDLLEANKHVEAVSLLIPFIIANPADALVYARHAIDAAVASGVKLLVWNTSGFIPPVRTGNAAIDVRIDIADYLHKSAIKHIIIQPSVYAENLLGPWTAPFVENENKVAYPTPSDMPVGWIATKDVARLIVKAIESPHLAGSNFLVSGVENLTGLQLATKFSIGLGRNIAYYAMPPADFGKILDSVFGEGAGKGAEEVYQQIADTKVYPPMHVPMESVLQQLPIDMTPMEDWVKQHSSQFTGKENR
jgi:uncharacterized protein YbjT (DUF2867 family)